MNRRGGRHGDLASDADTQLAALDLDFRQVGFVQDVGQAADQAGVDAFVLVLVVGHGSVSL